MAMVSLFLKLLICDGFDGLTFVVFCFCMQCLVLNSSVIAMDSSKAGYLC